MSLVIHRSRKHVEHPALSDRTNRTPIVLRTVVSALRKAITGAARLLGHLMQAMAEARMHRAMIETQLYRGRIKLSSKNDDDLPIVG